MLANQWVSKGLLVGEIEINSECSSSDPPFSNITLLLQEIGFRVDGVLKYNARWNI